MTEFDEGLEAGAKAAENFQWTLPVYESRETNEATDDTAEYLKDAIATAIRSLLGIRSGGERERIVAWLIEIDGPRYLSLDPGIAGFWTADHMLATRFGRRVDAENYLSSQETIDPNAGRIVEHMWTDAIESGAHLIAAALSAARREERELCAKIADAATRNIEAFENDALYPSILGRNEAAKEIASALRSSDGIPK